MNNISDIIERYLKKLLAESIQDFIEIQRSELANRFNCVPSQINYVLTTRFSTGRGYIVESRRGGGGFIRIVKLPLDQRVDLVLDISNLIGDSISQNDAAGLIRRLLEEGLITQREARLMRAAVDGNILRINLPVRDRLRALLLKAMVTAVLRE
ncbi:CtsR family transcriptional regulator [Pelotomaculum sp. PtaB.Bin117]|uniref:CtsR family transcriptional regulator n=1 Tax=Pelotomaculum sp. PtaB.Bin117 TaxID=1811694 RepID=UPI0009C78477|nr:CtsR family transcriptional regulator [Pelotomaculum sp. PtaB.Bin117]OPX89597.1 MAG: Transcriptional regulator CtsR [Pelotomaculum sp. PtaB.Bin117]OPY59895.1 MAG: Transcriptional regulator CtsR [Pelotomaculum sp. PtaU1.Bin065]